MEHVVAAEAFRRWISTLVLAAALPVLAAQKSTAVIDDPAYTHAQRLVTVEAGRRLNLYCTGRGAPTVVFDSGLGDGTKAWGLVQSVIAAHTRACSYDRAGLGFSDPSARPGTSANSVDGLHRLLQAAGIKPPYDLGRSFTRRHEHEAVRADLSIRGGRTRSIRKTRQHSAVNEAATVRLTSAGAASAAMLFSSQTLRD